MERGPELPAELASLTPAEREVLAALAAMGDATLSPEQLAALTSVEDPRPVLGELARRGFLHADEAERYGVPPGLRERLRRAWNLVDTGDRVLRQLISIAEDGRLTMADLDAVLGISEWACQTGRFEELLRLVQAVRTTVDVLHRVEAWVTIVHRAVQAARALGDTGAEAWAEGELAAAARFIGDNSTAEAHEQREQALRRPATQRPAAPRLSGRLLRLAALAGAAGVGLAAGFGLFHGSSPNTGPTTITAPPETVRLPRRTITAGGQTVTLPAATTTVPGTTVTVPGVVTTVTTTVTTTPNGGIQ
jgi:hypothetical protein